MAPRRGPGENEHKWPALLFDFSNHKPQVVKNGTYVTGNNAPTKN